MIMVLVVVVVQVVVVMLAVAVFVGDIENHNDVDGGDVFINPKPLLLIVCNLYLS